MKVFRVVKILLFNVFLLFVLMEAAAVAGYLVRTGKLYYSSPPVGKALPKQVEGWVEAYRIHPYLGFILRPTRPAGAPPRSGANNSFGFLSPFDYPYIRRHEREIIVGVFGGSAASKLAVFENSKKIISRRIAETTGRTVDDIRVLNLAQGGFKQPQQLLIYTYLRSLGQDLDIVVNFDGFNDIALAGRNAAAGIAIDMPSIEHVRALQEVTAISAGSAGLEQTLLARRAWAQYRQVFNRAWGGDAWELRFATGFMVDWLLYRFHYRKYLNARLLGTGNDNPATAVAPDTWLYLNPAKSAPEEWEAAVTSAVEVWSRSSSLLHQLVKADGGAYFHFVQPNQYFETEREFGAEEKQAVFNDQSPYPFLVPMGYSMLEKELSHLRDQEVRAEGLFHLFDDVVEPVYVDDCCHFTEAGQAVLAEAMGQVLGSASEDKAAHK